MIRSNDLNKVRPEKELVDALRAPARLERYIGVIYRPDTERASHYSTTKVIFSLVQIPYTQLAQAREHSAIHNCSATLNTCTHKLTTAETYIH